MKSLITNSLFLFSLLLNFQAKAQITEMSAPVGPTTTVEFSETEYDFGEIQQGEVVTHVFTFTNTGNNSLILSNAKGSCGCTVPEWPADPIAPGETASIVVQFDSKGKRNKQNKKVTLTMNTEPAQAFLFIKGAVLAPAPGQEVAEFKAEMPEKPSADCFMIYPNPTSEIMQIDMSKNTGKAAIISIYSKAGQLMAKREFEKVESNIVFNVSHYPPDTYIASVQVQGSRGETKCFVVVDN